MSLVDHDIPTSAFINHFVLERAISNRIPLQDATKQVLPGFSVQPDEVYPTAKLRLLSLFYCLLVYPSEHWRRVGMIDIVCERARTDKDAREEIVSFLNSDCVRRIRNAVSHGRIQFDGNEVHLGDGKDCSDPDFVLKMPTVAALNLLLVLGRAFHEARQVDLEIATAVRSTP